MRGKDSIPRCGGAGLDACSHVRRGLHYGVARDQFLIEGRAQFRDSLLRLEIDVVDSKPLAVPVRPLEVIHQTPPEVTPQWPAFGNGAMGMDQVIAYIHHAIGVVDVPVGGDHVVRRTAILGDIGVLHAPDLAQVARSPVSDLGPDHQPWRGRFRIRRGVRNHLVPRLRTGGADVGRRIDVEAHEVQRTGDDLHLLGRVLRRGLALARQIAVQIAAFENHRQELRVNVAHGLLGGANVRSRFDDRHTEARVLRQADARPWPGRRVYGLNRHAMRQNRVVPHLVHASARECQTGRLGPGAVAFVGEAGKFIDSEEVVHAIRKAPRHESGVIGEGFDRLLRLPTADPVLQRMRQIPVEQGHKRLDALGQQFVGHAVVMIDGFGVGLARAFRKDTRPRDGVAVALSPNRFQQPDVFLVTVVVVHRHVAGVAVVHLARRTSIRIPNGRFSPVFGCGPFDLVRSRCTAPQEAARKPVVILLGPGAIVGGPGNRAGRRRGSRRRDACHSFPKTTPRIFAGHIHLKRSRGTVVTRRTIRYVTAIRLRANGIIGNLADQTTTSPASTKPALARTLGLWDLVLIGVIMVQPTAPMPPFGIFYQTGRGHVVTTVLIAMVAMLFTAINYGRMARAYPGAGSAYTYVGREIHPALGFATGWSMMLDYLVNPLICTIWCAKAAMNLVPQVPYAVWATLIAVLFTWMNLRRIRTTARVNEILAAAMGVVIIWMLGMSVKYLMGITGLDTAFFTRPFYDPQTFSIPVILPGTSLATLTYIGFDGISTLPEGVHDQRRNVLLRTVLICLIIGVLSAIEVYAGQLVWPRGKAFPDVDTAYAFVAQIVGGRPLFMAVNLTILVASIGSGAGGQLSG